MFPIRFHMPAASVRPFVQFYAQREVSSRDPLFVHPVPARSSPMLEFVFGDPIRVTYFDSEVEETSPHVVFVGMQTRPFARLRLQGSLLSFVIMFQANGVERLFRRPAHEVNDASCDGRAFFDCTVEDLYFRLGDCKTFQERIRVADHFLEGKLYSALPLDSMGAVVERIRRSNGVVKIPELASLASVSPRQLSRDFNSRFGVGPKMFSMIVRFQSALDRKVRLGKPWTEVAHDLGYHDQMHMIHDFERFSASTPTETLKVVQTFFQHQIARQRDPELDVPLVV
ncbi:AraC family transcriptional regulator [Occallatibacter savannae]|uniref:AraC family transcriptional regulator n=1 Tax=Occallatibacter savannae TaxID=1002691 RepID=UPI000D68E8F6|nr:helix-turn-helix domain-containing protein [Occallatibacter savannae]